ncbi:MAG: uracil phosphoribosyltransferase [Alistipes sp.]|nr:uracil phosphoribosyltransferase [Alistipes sp.]MEE0914888.1 uracil phosphoribosyltransferase [Alistipes sp.]
MINILDTQNSLVNTYLSQLRSVAVQGDMMRFRRNIERIGEIMAYEISKTLNYAPQNITTPLGVKSVNLVADNVVLATILRAGLPLHQGFINYFDSAENAFISAYRKGLSESDFTIALEYLASPSLEGKTLIIADPMLATGASMVAVYKELIARCGKPAHTHIASVIGCPEGVKMIEDNIDLDNEATLWVATVDDYLNENKYIVPGLGDAGDLCFGPKL